MKPCAIVFDITGTLRYANNQAIDGAAAAIDQLRLGGYVLRCLTNNPRESAAQVQATLQEAGLHFETGEILTANSITVEYLATHFQGKRVFVLESSTTLSQQAAARGVIVTDEAPCEAVVLALGTIGTSPPDDGKLARAAALARSGARLFSTNVDRYVPVNYQRFIPASGSFVAVIEQLSGCTAEVIGKPSAWAAQRLLASLPSFDPAEVLMVGDHLESDVAFGQAMGAHTALVLTGLALPWERPVIEGGPHPPSVVLGSVAELPGWLESID